MLEPHCQSRNNKVLLCDRKRHTARRVTSKHYAVPVGGTPLSWNLTWTGGYPLPRSRWGYPLPRSRWGGYPISRSRQGVPSSQFQAGGYPILLMGVRPIQTWEGGTPSWPDGGTPRGGKSRARKYLSHPQGEGHRAKAI